MKILIVDDEVKILAVLKAYLEKENYEIITATDGRRALQIYKNEQPDLILIDLMLPDLSGEELCSLIRKESKVPIIMITAKTEDNDIVNGLDLGADDYINKPFSVKQVVARVKALIRRCYDTNEMFLSFNSGKLKVNFDKRIVLVNDADISLTNTEFNILNILVNNPKRIFSRDEILEKVLGYENESFDRVIDSHIKNLRQKIEEDTKNPVFIITVYGMGYKFEGKKD